MDVHPIILDVTAPLSVPDLAASPAQSRGSVNPLQFQLQQLHQRFPSLSMAELRTLKDQFDTFDLDGSGDITPAELGEALKSAGLEAPSRQKLNQMIAEHDEDHSGTITFDEFVSMVQKMKSEGASGGGAFGEIYGKVFEVGSFLTAAAKGDMFNVTRLLSNGVINANSSDYDKRTALHLASSEGHVDIVKTLISHDADPNCKDRFGNTPLDDAVRHNRDQVAALLRSYNAEFGNSENFKNEMLTAAASGDITAVQRLLDMKITPDFGDYDGRTPLHLCASEGHIDIVKLLLENKANVHAVDRFGGTPMTDAARSGVRTGSDAVREILERYGAVSKTEDSQRKNPFLYKVLLFWEFIFVLFFWLFVRYNGDAATNGDGPDRVSRLYPFFQDVHVMIFIGFGFLMTFLRKYGYTSVGLNFLLAAMVLQWYVLVSGFWQRAFGRVTSWSMIDLDLDYLINGDFCAGSVLITFGALLGKTSFTQMALIAIFETVFYSMNEEISFRLQISDIGGSMVIHTFGAYFGLTLSLILTPAAAKGRSDNSACYRSDLFSMIGTIFLWMYWPSFNGAFGLGNSRHRAILNTLFSLTGACVSAFMVSHFLRRGGELSMVDVQNATLAGGVAAGSVANMNMLPGGALTMGVATGALSVFGFTKIQPFLEKKVGLHDTCGVNNLHGMPGIISAIGSVILAAMATQTQYGNDLQYVFPAMTNGRSSQLQAANQLAFLGVTLAIAIGGAIFTGYAVRLIDPVKTYFLDDASWEVPALETPYYFDKRGEVNRQEIKEAIDQVKPMDKNNNIASKDLRKRAVNNNNNNNNNNNSINNSTITNGGKFSSKASTSSV